MELDRERIVPTTRYVRRVAFPPRDAGEGAKIRMVDEVVHPADFSAGVFREITLQEGRFALVTSRGNELFERSPELLQALGKYKRDVPDELGEREPINFIALTSDKGAYKAFLRDEELRVAKEEGKTRKLFRWGGGEGDVYEVAGNDDVLVKESTGKHMDAMSVAIGWEALEMAHQLYMPDGFKQYRPVQLYGIVQAKERDFIVMERIDDAINLEAILKNDYYGNQRYDKSSVRDYFQQAKTLFDEVVDDHIAGELKRLGILSDHDKHDGNNVLYAPLEGGNPPFELVIIDPVGFGGERMIKFR